MYNILVCDDDKEIVEAIEIYLSQEGYKVLKAYDGEEALKLLDKHKVDLLIIDVMMPRLDGIRATLKIREKQNMPIIILSAKSEDADKILGLNVGADDYMTKPFSLKELHARVEAISRRASDDLKPLAEKIQWNDGALEINFQQKIVKKHGRVIGLTPIEWNILSAFFKYPKKVFTREDLISIAFDMGFDGYDRVIDTHIKNIRKKLEDNPKQPVYIQTVHGLGYRLGGDSS